MLPIFHLNEQPITRTRKRKIADAEIVIAHRIDDKILTTRMCLEWIQSLSAGYNRFDLETLTERQIVLTTASIVHGEPIAQHVLGYTLWFEHGFSCA